jgi:hypothetical protein
MDHLVQKLLGENIHKQYDETSNPVKSKHIKIVFNSSVRTC